MRSINIEKFDIVTDGDGDWTETRLVPGGAFLQYRYVVDGTSPLATGAGLVEMSATA